MTQIASDKARNGEKIKDENLFQGENDRDNEIYNARIKDEYLYSR